jgi:hypothetical protein
VNFNIGMKLHRDGEVRVLKWDYILQQGAAIQYYKLFADVL